jgi:hypothetical protein
VPRQDSFFLAPPSLSLPTGGGAIRGIGEKKSAFTVKFGRRNSSSSAFLLIRGRCSPRLVGRAIFKTSGQQPGRL